MPVPTAVPPNANGWIPEVFTCSAIDGTNIEAVAEVIDRYQNHQTTSGFIAHNRHEQDKRWLRETLKELLLADFFSNEQMLKALLNMENAVAAGEISSFQAADQLYELFKHGRNL